MPRLPQLPGSSSATIALGYAIAVEIAVGLAGFAVLLLSEAVLGWLRNHREMRRYDQPAAR
jgi:hypothetical protein